MKLSNQAMGALMMALQKSLMEQSDIVEMLREFDLSIDGEGTLVIENPPVLRFPEKEEEKEKIMPREEDF